MSIFEVLFSPRNLAPLTILLLLMGLYLKGACNALNHAVDDNPSASIEPPSFLRALAILVIMFSFVSVANWGMAKATSQLEPEHFKPVLSYLPTKDEGKPVLTTNQVLQTSVSSLLVVSGLLQYLFCVLLIMYGFTIRFRQANVIGLLFLQRAVIYSTILVVLTGFGIGFYLQQGKKKSGPNPKAETPTTENSQSSKPAAAPSK